MPEPEIKWADGVKPAAAYLTIDEVAARYRTKPNTVRYWRHVGTGPKGIRVGNRVLYPLTEIEKFDRQLEEQAAAGNMVFA